MASLRAPWSPHTVADPFLFAHGDELLLFSETQVADDFGRITVTKLRKGLAPKHAIALAEPFHLSSPCVFEHDGSIYLLPESQGAGELRLYRFERFPTSFMFLRTLAIGKFADPSPVLVEGIWYIFVTTENGLELFFTDDLERGELRSHPANPLTDDPRYRRCGGMAFLFDGKLVRPAQNCANGYGRNLSLLEITEISPLTYREELLADDILRTDERWNSGGGHHLSVCAYQGKMAVAIDGQAPDYLHHKLLTRAFMIFSGRRRR